ncbi:hypothetical protein NLU03_24960 [Bacillus toyonensis]|nr:hypothetical protein [Bacillus toyonensis]
MLSTIEHIDLVGHVFTFALYFLVFFLLINVLLGNGNLKMKCKESFISLILAVILTGLEYLLLTGDFITV